MSILRRLVFFSFRGWVVSAQRLLFEFFFLEGLGDITKLWLHLQLPVSFRQEYLPGIKKTQSKGGITHHQKS